jgi:hypothetical protein
VDITDSSYTGALCGYNRQFLHRSIMRIFHSFVYYSAKRHVSDILTEVHLRVIGHGCRKGTKKTSKVSTTKKISKFSTMC